MLASAAACSERRSQAPPHPQSQEAMLASAAAMTPALPRSFRTPPASSGVGVCAGAGSEARGSGPQAGPLPPQHEPHVHVCRHACSKVMPSRTKSSTYMANIDTAFLSEALQGNPIFPRWTSAEHDMMNLLDRACMMLSRGRMNSLLLSRSAQLSPRHCRYATKAALVGFGTPFLTVAPVISSGHRLLVSGVTALEQAVGQGTHGDHTPPSPTAEQNMPRAFP